ncbi:50S ribosomal protein L27 [Candidatus Vidania fulgoroideorum]
MAKKKAAGSLKNGRDSISKRLGIKIFGGQRVTIGGIIIRQRGSSFFPGFNTNFGKDNTIFSKINGIVFFKKMKKKTIVSVFKII